MLTANGYNRVRRRLRQKSSAKIRVAQTANAFSSLVCLFATRNSQVDYSGRIFTKFDGLVGNNGNDNNQLHFLGRQYRRGCSTCRDWFSVLSIYHLYSRPTNNKYQNTKLSEQLH